MAIDTRPILLAGTRVTGDKPHIGTFYGWITQIKRAMEFYRVIILIADYQSFDSKHILSVKQEAQNLKSVFNKFLPDVPVVIESDIQDITKLGMLIAKYIKPRYYKRIMPIRKHLDDNNNRISFYTLFYPAMMIADIIALNATYMFNKPEGKFQHSEVLNDIISDINKKFCLNINLMKIFPKQSFYIFSLDGTGPMKRNREQHGVINIDNTTYEEILNNLHLVKIPKTRCKDCIVIKSIWNAVVNDTMNPNTFLSCEICLQNLAKKICTDISVEHLTKKIDGYDAIIKQCENNVKTFINTIESSEFA